MVDLLGILLAAMLFWAGTRLWRGVCAAGRVLRSFGTRTGRQLGLSEVRLRWVRASCRTQEARIAALSRELERTRQLLRVLEHERRLRAEAAARRPAEERFLRAKRAFALHFHPDRLRAHPDAPVRRRIFQEFWDVLRRIERS
jgi:hypothetical protein